MEKVYFLTYNNFSDDLKSRFTEAFKMSGGFPNMSKLLRHMYIMYSDDLSWINSWYEGWLSYRNMYQVTRVVTEEYGRYLDKFMCNLIDYYKMDIYQSHLMLGHLDYCLNHSIMYI